METLRRKTKAAGLQEAAVVSFAKQQEVIPPNSRARTYSGLSGQQVDDILEDFDVVVEQLGEGVAK